MTAAIYATDDMEECVRALAARHRTVLITMDYKSVRPIRMRTSAKLSDLEIDWVMGWKPDARERIERWHAAGGIMQFRANPIAKRPWVPQADAILMVECPMQWDRFDLVVQCARQEAVVYRPPTWKAHEDTIEHLYPRRDTYTALDAYLDSLALVPPREELVAACKLPGFDRSVAFTAADVKAIFGWSEKYLRFTVAPLKYTVHRWHPYSLRLKPDDPDLVWAWDILREQPEIARRVYAMRHDAPVGRPLGFKTMHRLLVRGKYISPRECIYVADADRAALRADEFDALNNMRRGKWFKLRNFVDELPEYPI